MKVCAFLLQISIAEVYGRVWGLWAQNCGPLPVLRENPPGKWHGLPLCYLHGMSEVDLTNLRFGEYQAISELGRGATSTVYLAEKKFGRFETMSDSGAPGEAASDFPVLDAAEAPSKPARAAVKVVSFTDETSKLSRRFRKLFATEAWVASQLDHPNITKVFDWKVEDERAYLVLEYLEGQTLDEYVTMDKLLPVQQVVDIMHKVAVALDYAHRRGVVNRDVKPANVMLCANGDVKLMDFGLALNIKKNVNIDSTYINGLGSPSYMSPEQIKGYTLNHQTDLYSLGVMFYQLLTGRLPFRAKNTASLVYKIVNTEAVPVNQLNPELPEFTHKVISRAMEKDLYSRYRQGAQFAKDLSDAPYQRVKPGSTVNLDVRWKAVRGLPLLGGLDDMDVWELLRASNWREYPPAKMIMQEGEAGKSFGLVIDGLVEIENGATSMTIASRGDFIGIAEWLDSAVDARRASSATTLDKVVYLEINPAAFTYATEELSEEIHRLATDSLIKRMRSVMRVAKQLSPPAIHPAPEAVETDADEAAAASVSAPGSTPENPLGWGAFARVDSRAATDAVPAAPAAAPHVAQPLAAGRVPAAAPAPAAASAPESPVPSTAASAPVAPVPVPAVSVADARSLLAAAPPTLAPSSSSALDATRRQAVVVQPLSASAAAAITQLALGGGAGTQARATAPAFDLGPPSASHPDFVPLLLDDDHTVPNPPKIASVSELPADSVLTTEMGANFNATTAYATTDMAANFMSTVSLDDAADELREAEPGVLMPEFDVHQGGADTSEMAANFAGTTAFRTNDFTPPAAPSDDDGGNEILTSEMAPNFAGTTAFSFSDTPPPLPEGPGPVAAKAVAPTEPELKTQELAAHFASTTAFMSRDTAPRPAAKPVPPAAPAFDPEKTTILEGGFDAPAPEFDAEKTVILKGGLDPPAPQFDGEKTVILKGGFDRSGSDDAGGAGRFTEEMFPAIGAVTVGSGFGAQRRSLKDVPPEDFDKTVEISGGFESQPVEEEAPLDDLFPPIKF